MTTPASPSYAGHRFSAKIISYAGWLYFRFPLSLRRVVSLFLPMWPTDRFPPAWSAFP
jgi:transposase-like protein